MKKQLLVLTLIMLLLLPFAAADSFASLLGDYNKAKAEYSDIRDQLDECRLLDEDCEDFEDDILGPAIDYAKAGINLMIAYIDYVDNSDLDDAETNLEQALDNLKYADTKEEFDDALDLAKTAWIDASVVIRMDTIGALYEEVDGLVDTGEILKAKLKCGIGELDSSTNDLDNAYENFAKLIGESDDNMDEAEALLNADSLTEAFEYIKKSQNSLKESQAELETALSALESSGGKLCDEVVIEDDDEEDEADDEDEEADDDEDEETDDDSEDDEEKDFDTMLEDVGVESQYNDAKEAVEDLVDYIEKKQDDGYSTTKADSILAEAENYLETAEDKIMDGKSGISYLLNAKETAKRGMNSEYYVKKSTTNDSSNATDDFEAFVTCMENAGYKYQRESCYDDYGIESDTQVEIEDCLYEGTDDYTCYDYAEDEAEKQEDEEAQDLQDRVDELRNNLDDIESEVEDLLDNFYQAADDAGLEEGDNEYDDLEDDIKQLLDDVQSQNSDYDDDLDNVEELIDDENYDDADSDLDDLNDEINGNNQYIDDIKDKIADFEDDVNAL
ncbi:hypothetical protein COV16_00890 [Candidatus Woesearchaeota archaeon CG10_big_fil_rev_8_21_14_0_10_34_8]|nr:MAG: hypothetical protein COV16_00890 [Candidatus Woesearchaeota archaeon CG10_big_fil_rev_8_21_14_0_10_34_8]